MQYILSEEEYKSLIPVKEYKRKRDEMLDENARLENIINSLKNEISTLKNEILKDSECPDKGNAPALFYCDGCVLGFEGLNVCTSSRKRYSK